MVTRATKHSKMAFIYIGAAKAARLRRAWRVPRALASSLTPGSAGANRNLLLLLTAGRQVLFVDDDIVLEPWELPDRRHGWTVAGHDERREFRFFPTRRAALALVTRPPIDLLGAHEELLGRQVGAVPTDAALDLPDLNDACAHLKARVAQGRPMTVRVTCAGMAGDAGRPAPDRLLFSRGSLRERLWSSAREFRTAMTSREERRVAVASYATHAANTPAGCLALENRRLAPPFPPISRNEDGVFGALLAATDAAALFGHLAVGVLHDSARRSPYTEAERRGVTQVRVAELLIVLIRRLARTSARQSPAARLRDVGAGLQDVAGWKPLEFKAFVAGVMRTARFQQIDAAERDALTQGCPQYWRDALADCRRRVAAAADSPWFALPIEFHDRAGIDAGYRALAGFVRRFGALVEAWPALWTRARRLRTIAASTA